MKLRFALILFLSLLNLVISAQKDSVICNLNCQMNEGVYINYEDFRSNDPVRKEQIESNLNKEILDFFGKVLEPEKILFSKGNEKFSVNCKTVWGYCQNNVLHINYKGKFYRVPVFGSISYLMASVEVITPSYYPGYGGIGGMGMTTNYKTTEVREFLMNYYDGIMMPFNMELAEKLISRDSTVYAEFKTLKHKKQKEQISRYFRKYNELHPIYFLK